MVGVVIIAVLFTGGAILVAYLASRGGFAGLSSFLVSTNRATGRLLNTTLVFVYIGFGVAVPLIFIMGNHNNSNAKVAGIQLTAAEQSGRELFADHCAVCHTLASDNAVGKTGPNLDVLRPTEAQVLHTIQNGCLQQPTNPSAPTNCLAYGTMPANVVTGQQAVDVAKFVAAIAGHT